MDKGIRAMENQQKKEAATRFATLFAGALGETLGSVTGAEWSFEPAEFPGKEAQTDTPIQFQLHVEGSLKGECFIELREADVLAIISGIAKQSVTALHEEHFEAVAKVIVSSAEKLATSHADEYGVLRFKVERVSELAFGGMFVVPLMAKGAVSDMQILLFIGGELMDALSCGHRAEDQWRQGDLSVHPHNLQMVMDVELNVSLRFGQRRLQLREVLDLASGSVVELDRMVDEPVELFLDGKLIARGEAVVVDGNYGLRVTEIPQPVMSHFLN